MSWSDAAAIAGDDRSRPVQREALPRAARAWPDFGHFGVW